MKLDIAREKIYGANALTYAKKSGRGGNGQPPLPTIKPNTPDWDAWRQYFVEHVGFEPIAMQRIKAGWSSEMTVPADRPEQFDGSYAAAIELKQKLDKRASWQP